MTAVAAAGYPKTVVLADGAHLVLRPPAAGEAPGGDPERLAAVVAVDGERVAAEGSLHRRGPREAALRLVLDPAYRGRRLGTWMLLDLVHLADALDVERLIAEAPADDVAFLAALRRLDFVETARAPGDAADRVRLVKRLHRGWTDF